MNILIICHVEKSMEPYCDEDMAKRIASLSNLYDKVINVTSHKALVGDDLNYDCLEYHYNIEEEEWVWGGEPNYGDLDEENQEIYDKELTNTLIVNEYGEEFIRPSKRSHDFQSIPHWFDLLSISDKYTIVGGGKYECLNGLMCCFETKGFNIKYGSDQYIYGS